MERKFDFNGISFTLKVGENALFVGDDFEEAVKDFEQTIRGILKGEIEPLEVVKDDQGGIDLTLAYGGPNVYLTIAYDFIIYTYVYVPTRLVVHLEGYYLGDVVKERIEEKFGVYL